MSVLKIDTDRYTEAAELSAAAGRGLADAVASADAVLVGTGGMAGWDSLGTDWAASYDPAATDVLEASRALALASTDSARALTFSAGNYIAAEHVAAMGLAALVEPLLPSSMPEATSSCLPSACEAHVALPPEYWDIVAGVAGIMWPTGDPALLRSAGAAWTTLASDVEHRIGGGTQLAEDTVDGLLAEDLALFRTRSAVVREAGTAIALSSRDIAAGCEALAGAIETAHQELIDETRAFAEDCLEMLAVGVALSFLTLGGSAAITSLIGVARTAQMVMKVRQTIERLTALGRAAVVVASRLPGAARLTTGLQSLARGSSALRITGGPGGHALTAGAPRTSAALSTLAPAVRIIRPVGAAGARLLDSKAVSVALSSPAALVREQLSHNVGRRILGNTAVPGDATEQVLAVAGRSASPIVARAAAAAQVGITSKERWDNATGLVALPASLKERYAPATPDTLAPAAGGPGRLTAVRRSPGTGPMAVSSRGPRTSHPAASQ